MFTLESIPERAMVARLGEPARELRPPVRDGGTSSIAVDGSLVVWVEGRGRDRNNYYRELELWRGELSPGLAITDARVVTRLTRRTMVTPLLGGGMVALPLHDDDTELAIVRLATGEMRRLAPPDGLAIEEIHWIAAGEICVRIGQGGRTVMPSTIRRIPIDSLPPAPRP